MTGHTIPGVLANMVPSAVQSVFDLRGPAFSVDSACASSLIALDTACDLLALGRVDACVAGGVYLTLTPEAHVGFSLIGALSPSGVCRPFDAAADGFVVGEGGALLLLRRLADAERDGDDIWGVIEARGTSNDGRAPGVMTPTVDGQYDAVRTALDGLEASELRVDAVEAHGTGTVVGDRIELETLHRSAPSAAPGSIRLGSVKGLIGHTMAASGALALVKVLLVLTKGRWTPQPAASPAGWHTMLSGSPFTIDVSDDDSRPIERVALNAFGFGGTNCHMLVAGAQTVGCHV